LDEKPDLSLLNEIVKFQKSRAILSAAELDLFTAVDETPAAAPALAERTGTDLRALTRLLDCLITYGLLDKGADDCYCNTETGAFLSERHPDSILPMTLHLSAIWKNWDRLTDSVQLGVNPELESIVQSRTEQDRKAFIGGMHVLGRRMARSIVSDLDLSSHRRLLDIGGGSGIYTIACLENNPALEAVIFDLEDVIPLARARLEEAGLLDRVTLETGDFYEDPLPAGADVALLSAIVHQNSLEQNVELYRKIHEALEPGGVLLIRDYIMDSARTSPARGAQFALHMLVCTPGGDTYTLEEMREGLEAAGFVDAQLVRTGELMESVVQARKGA